MNTSTAQETKTNIEKVSLWKVVFVNDDYTPIDFVEAMLVHLFHKTPQEAHRISKSIHLGGKGTVGVFIKEIAELKAFATIAVARENGHPLLAIVEAA